MDWLDLLLLIDGETFFQMVCAVGIHLHSLISRDACSKASSASANTTEWYEGGGEGLWILTK